MVVLDNGYKDFPSFTDKLPGQHVGRGQPVRLFFDSALVSLCSDFIFKLDQVVLDPEV